MSVIVPAPGADADVTATVGVRTWSFAKSYTLASSDTSKRSRVSVLNDSPCVSWTSAVRVGAKSDGVSANARPSITTLPDTTGLPAASRRYDDVERTESLRHVPNT